MARLASASKFRVETTGAIAGVRGTEFGMCEGPTCPRPIMVRHGKVWRMMKSALATDLKGEDAPKDKVWELPTPPETDTAAYYQPVAEPAD